MPRPDTTEHTIGDLPSDQVMLVHTVTNAYAMPDGIDDTHNNDEVQLYYVDPPPSNASVYWTFHRESETGAYRIRSVPNRKYVGIRGSAQANSHVVLQDAKTTNQLWVPVPIPGLIDDPDRPLVRAFRLHQTTYAMGGWDTILSRDINLHLIRAWHQVPTLFHAFTIIPATTDDD
jgi:hypothetical protein